MPPQPSPAPTVIPSVAEGSGFPARDSSAPLRSARNDRKRKSGWSDARRAKHAAAIRNWKPWAKSTGPRTSAGKARAAQNAYKHGGRATETRLMHQALAAQNHFRRGALLYARLSKLSGTNELLKAMAPRLRALDRIFHVRMHQSLKMADIMQKSCFLLPPAANS